MAQAAQQIAAAQPPESGLLTFEGKRGRFARIPHEIFDDTTLTARQRDLWGQIRRRDWQGEGWVFTHAELARVAGCSVPTLARMVRVLEGRGLVRAVGPAKRAKRYFATIPEQPPDIPEGGRGGLSDTPTMIDPTDHDDRSDDAQMIDPTRQNDRSDTPTMIDPTDHDDRSTPEVPYLDQRRSKTIKDDSAAAQQRAAPLPDSQESIGAELTGHAVAAAILEAQGRPASPAAVARMAPACTDEVTVPYRGQVTLVQIRACLVAMRRKKFFREKPHALTPRRLGEDLGPWLRCDEMRDGSPPERVLCDCLTREGYLHTTARCGLSGKVSATNYREQGRGWRLHTPAGVVDEREDDHGSSPGG